MSARAVGFLCLLVTALGRGLLALARCALLPESESSARDLLDYLRAPGVLKRPELADSLELEVLRQGLRTVAQARARTPLLRSALLHPGHVDG